MPTKRDEKTKNQPYVSNYPPLDAWLKARNASCLWQVMRGPREAPTQAVEGWLVGRRVVIVLVNSNNCGWDIFTSETTGKIDATFADADARVGWSPKTPDAPVETDSDAPPITQPEAK